MLIIDKLELEYCIEDVDAVAKALLEALTSKTVLFYGAMGVGKTTLIKAIVKALGSTDTVNSPTFSIVNEYKADDTRIYHFDLYRLQDIEEAYNIGIEDYLYSDSYCLIEWPETIETLLPDHTNSIVLEENDNKLRILKLKL